MNVVQLARVAAEYREAERFYFQNPRAELLRQLDKAQAKLDRCLENVLGGSLPVLGTISDGKVNWNHEVTLTGGVADSGNRSS